MNKPSPGISRRDFIAKGSASLGTLATLPAFARSFAGQSGGQRKVIHIIGHSHIDAAWLWPWRDGSDEALNTFRSALNRMIETADFCYSHSSSAHYRWVERADPAMFAEIQQRVKEGRWEVIGGWPVEPDCNIPSTESFVRHSLYGKEYCRRALDVDVTIGFNPDSFGHAAGLPTILKRAGYDYYSFMRPGSQDDVNLPQLFWWEGADGSRVLALHMLDYDDDAEGLKQAATANFAPGLDHAAYFLGVGDHGGGHQGAGSSGTGPVGLVAIADASDTWAHGINQFRQEMGRPMLISSMVIENGAVTRVTRQRARWMDSEIVLDIAQFAGLDFLELRFVIDWHQHEQMLKLEIPTALTQPKILAKVPGQVLERKTNGEEEPYQDWGAVQGKVGDADYTVALLNNSTYSYDCLNGLFRTVLIRSAPFARHNPAKVPYNDNNAWQDQGRQERTFWLMARRGPYANLSLDRRAEELQTPAEYVADSAHKGTEPWEQSFLDIMPSSVWVVAIKRPEGAEDGTIIRIQERAGVAVQASLKSLALGLNHTVGLSPWELKTLLVKSAKGHRAELRGVSLLES